MIVIDSVECFLVVLTGDFQPDLRSKLRQELKRFDMC